MLCRGVSGGAIFAGYCLSSSVEPVLALGHPDPRLGRKARCGPEHGQLDTHLLSHINLRAGGNPWKKLAQKQ